MDEQAALTFLAQWCFTIQSPKSPAALQFIQGIEHIPEIQCCYPLDTSGVVYLVFPHAQHEETVNSLCAENGFVRISEERSRSFLTDFRQRHQSSWEQLLESMG